MLSDRCDAIWAARGQKPAVREGSAVVTFAELRTWSDAIASALEHLGVRPGVPLLLFLPNSARFVAAFYGAARVGAVVNPVGVALRAGELSTVLSHVAPAAIVTDSGGLRVASDAVRGSVHRPAVLVVDGPGAVEAFPRGDGPRARALPEHALLQLQTSGSTGRPKTVARTHAALVRELEALAAVFRVDERDRFVGAVPFAHVNGLVRTMMLAMFVGAELHPADGFRREEFLALVARARPTFLGGVPPIFAALTLAPPRETCDLSSLRTVFSSSAPLPVDVSRRFSERFHLVVRQLYGSTETGTIAFNRAANPETSRRSVGQPLPGVRVEVRDGEIAVASPFAAAGYVADPEASARAFRGPFYLTGDLGVVDGEGAITLSGRMGLLINRGGFKVNPIEVEEVLAAHPKVKEALVYGDTSSYASEVVCCDVVAHERCAPGEILAFCRERLAEYKVPSRIRFCDALAKGPSGKVLRRRPERPAV